MRTIFALICAASCSPWCCFVEGHRQNTVVDIDALRLETADSKNLVSVIFKLENATTKFGEELRIVGNLPELNGWSPQKAPLLVTDAESYPMWQTQVLQFKVSATEPTEVLYKYLKDRQAWNKEPGWESIKNRKFIIPAGAKEVIVIDPAFDEARFGWSGIHVSMTVSVNVAIEEESDDGSSDTDSAVVQYGVEEGDTVDVDLASISGSVTSEMGVVDSAQFSSVWHPWKEASTILSRMGKGTYGTTWHVEFACAEEPWHAVVKRATTHPKLPDRVGAEFFLQEMAMKGNPFALAIMQHHHVPNARFEYGLVEYMQGGDLAKVIDNTWAEGLAAVDGGRLARLLFAQLVRAVMLMHKNGVVHRSLKPNNILVNKAVCVSPEVNTAEAWLNHGCIVKIADFGLGCAVDDSSTAACSKAPPSGSVSYVSPEQLNSVAPSPTMDVWSLGIVFYELLFRKFPYQDEVKMEDPFLSNILTNLRKAFAGDLSKYHTMPQGDYKGYAGEDGALDVLKMTLKLNSGDDSRATIAEVWESDYVKTFHEDVLSLEKEELLSPSRTAPDCVPPAEDPSI